MTTNLEIKILNILAQYALSFAPTEKQYGMFSEEAFDSILFVVREEFDSKE